MSTPRDQEATPRCKKPSGQRLPSRYKIFSYAEIAGDYCSSCADDGPFCQREHIRRNERGRLAPAFFAKGQSSKSLGLFLFGIEPKPGKMWSVQLHLLFQFSFVLRDRLREGGRKQGLLLPYGDSASVLPHAPNVSPVAVSASIKRFNMGRPARRCRTHWRKSAAAQSRSPGTNCVEPCQKRRELFPSDKIHPILHSSPSATKNFSFASPFGLPWKHIKQTGRTGSLPRPLAWRPLLKQFFSRRRRRIPARPKSGLGVRPEQTSAPSRTRIASQSGHPSPQP